MQTATTCTVKAPKGKPSTEPLSVGERETEVLTTEALLAHYRSGQPDGSVQHLYACCNATIRLGAGEHVRTALALGTIKQHKLYRVQGYSSFEAYLEEHWGYSRQHGDRLAEFAHFVELVLPYEHLPTESLYRVLHKPKAGIEKEVEIWKTVVAEIAGEVTPDAIRHALAKHRGPNAASSSTAANPTKPQNTVQMRIHVPPALAALTKAEAEKRGITATEVVQQALEFYFATDPTAESAAPCVNVDGSDSGANTTTEADLGHTAGAIPPVPPAWPW